MRTLLLVAACLGIAAAATVLHAVHMLPNHDNDFLLVAAERLLAGGRYRADFIESNPPLIIVLNLPAVLLAQATGLAAYAAFSAYVAGLILLSALLAARPLGLILRPEGGSTGLALVAMVAVLALEPGHEYGQREHLATILLLPGLLWLAAREAGRDPGFGPGALAVLALAAVAVLIKPFTLLLPAAFFAARLLRRPRLGTLADPALGVLVVLGAGYAALVLLAFPDYFEEAAIQSQVYFAWNRTWLTVLGASKDAVAVLALAAVATALAPVAEATRRAVFHLVAAAALCLVVAVLQRKGWTYHLLPVVELSLVALALLAAILLPRLAAAAAGRAQAAVVLAAMAMATGFLMLRPGWELVSMSRERFRGTSLLVGLNRLAEGRPYLLMTGGYQRGVPSMAGGTLGSRSISQVYLPGAAQLAAGNAAQQARAAALKPLVVRELLADFARFRPAIVAVDVQAGRQGLPDGFDILGYYLEDAEFRGLWAGYAHVLSLPGWEFYARREP